MKISTSNKVKTAVSVIIAVLIWQTAAVLINQPLLFASPISTLTALFSLLHSGIFYKACLSSFARITSGFLIALLTAAICSVLSYRCRSFEILIRPYVITIKSIPVISFILIALLFIRSKNLSILISALISFPVIFQNILEGLKSTDAEMLEVACIFKLPAVKKIRHIYFQNLKPFLCSSLPTASGFAWKAGIAAEVLALSKPSIGTQIYDAKIYFETAELYALTLTIILLSLLFEKMLSKLLKVLYGINEKESGHCAKKNGENKTASHEARPVTISNLTKHFGNIQVYDKYSAVFEGGETSTINGASGSGKTTLLKIIAGLVKPDSGTVDTGDMKISMLFQEDRLCEELSALSNVLLVTNKEKKEEAVQLLKSLGIDRPQQKTDEMSGGQKRRVSLARTLIYDADLYLLDEPYSGLDEKTKTATANAVAERTKDKTVIIATH